MNVKVAMLYDDNLKLIGDVSSSRAEAYCARHGYSFSCARRLLDEHLSPSWNKILKVRDELDGCDWVFWMDADTYVFDMDFDLAAFLSAHRKRDFIVSVDYNGMCCGVFALRSSAWSRAFVNALLFLGRMDPAAALAFEGRDNYEQSAIKLLKRNFVNVDRMTSFIPQEIVRNRASPPSQRVPFLFHYWSSMGAPYHEAIKSDMLAHS